MLASWSTENLYIWDLVAAVTATDARLCPEVQLALEVVTTPGDEQGRLVVADGPANIWVCLDPDAGADQGAGGCHLTIDESSRPNGLNSADHTYRKG